MRNVDVTEWYYGELETSTFMSSLISNPFSHSLGQQENGNQPYWRSVMANCYNAAKWSFLLTHWCNGVWILIHKIELIVLRLLVWIVFEYLFLSFSSSPLTVTKTAELSNWTAGFNGLLWFISIWYHQDYLLHVWLGSAQNQLSHKMWFQSL